MYGAGGVGAFFGGLLARAGQDVHFVARGPQLEAIRSRGIRIRSTTLGQIDVAPVRASERAADAGVVRLALICLKAHHNAAILDDLSNAIGSDTIVVPLQNGVDSDEVLAARFGRERVAPAVVYVGATVDEPGIVTHVARGHILIGARPGFDASRLVAVREALAATGLPVEIVEDIQYERWRKLLWNASFNPVSALTLREPADLLAHPRSRELILGLMREVVRVARAQGINLEESEIDDQIAWTDGARSIRTSMTVDRELGRSMETEALVGVIVRKGRELRVPTPLSEVLYALLTAIDR